MGLELSAEAKVLRSSCSTVAGLHRGGACVPQGQDLHSTGAALLVFHRGRCLLQNPGHGTPGLLKLSVVQRVGRPRRESRGGPLTVYQWLKLESFFLPQLKCSWHLPAGQIPWMQVCGVSREEG